MLCGIFFIRGAFFIDMNLSMLRIGEEGIVVAVKVPPALRERLRALGVGEEKKVRILRYSLLKSSLMVETEETVIALRREIADKTEVRRIGDKGNFVGGKSEYGKKHPL
jgi:Fe2+ transport system protein FeoA